MNTATWSKKLVFALMVVLCATALTWRGALPVDEWLGLVKAIGVTYILAQGSIDLIRGKGDSDGVQQG